MAILPAKSPVQNVVVKLGAMDMAGVRKETKIDPTTNKPLPDGVDFRGKGKYRARKLVRGARVAKTFATAALAAKWLNHAQTDKDRNTFIDTTVAERTILRMVLQRYREEETPVRRAAANAKKEAEHITAVELSGPDLEAVARCEALKPGGLRSDGKPKLTYHDITAMKMTELLPEHFAAWRNVLLASGLAPNTVIRRMNLVQTIIKHARAEWQIRLPENPSVGVRRPAAGKPKKRWFKDGEREVVERAANEDTNPYVGPIFRWAVSTGMRRGEMISINRHTDIVGKVCVVRGLSGEGSKNNEIREVPLFEDALAVLEELEAMWASGRVVRPLDSRLFPVQENVLSVRWGRAMKREGIADMPLHNLRHIGTAYLAQFFPNPMNLRLATGHKDLKSLQGYYDISGEELHRLGLGQKRMDMLRDAMRPDEDMAAFIARLQAGGGPDIAGLSSAVH